MCPPGPPVRSFGPAAAFVFLLSSAEGASAGAWTLPEGDGQMIVTLGSQGGMVPGLLGSDTPRRTTGQVYAEYGLRDGLTVGGKLYVETVGKDENDGAAALGAFVRRRVWQNPETGGVGSVQIEGQVPVERFIDPELAQSQPYSTAELGVRGQYGRSWWGNGRSAFVSTGAAWTWRSEGQSPDIRLEATGGYAPREDWLGLLSIRSQLPLRDTGTEPSLIVTPSVAYHFGPPGKERTSVQLGVGYDFLSGDEGAIGFIGLWRRF